MPGPGTEWEWVDQDRRGSGSVGGRSKTRRS